MPQLTAALFDNLNAQLALTFSRPVVDDGPLTDVDLEGVINAQYLGDSVASNVGNTITLDMAFQDASDTSPRVSFPAGTFVAADNADPCAAVVDFPVTIT